MDARLQYLGSGAVEASGVCYSGRCGSGKASLSCVHADPSIVLKVRPSLSHRAGPARIPSIVIRPQEAWG